MNAERRQIAWDLVHRYLANHLQEIPQPQRRKFQHFDREKIAPLGALVAIELARLRLSYTAAAIRVGKNLPEEFTGPTLAPSTFHYFQKPERAHWQAQPATLEQLSWGFGWDLNWLRRINCEPVATGETNDIRKVVEIMAELPADRQQAIHSFAKSLADQYHSDQRPVTSSRPDKAAARLAS